MAGKGSRARRVEAYTKAKADVYKANGAAYDGTLQYTDERMQRIYTKAYTQWQTHYHNMEALSLEMFQVYGT